jgi:hypothetical protein
MYRTALPRLYELRCSISDPVAVNAYFKNLEDLRDRPEKLRQYRILEQDLARLDDIAWSALKMKLVDYLTAKHDFRGGHQLFNALNEAKGYHYLKQRGCDVVSFIPVSTFRGQKTPDLEGYAGGQKMLCEVKTINMSDVEEFRRASHGSGSVTTELAAGFFNKLASDLKNALAQLNAYDPHCTAIKIAYVVINFDDSLHEYETDYGDQIRCHLANNPIPGLEIELYWRPPFDMSKV